MLSRRSEQKENLAFLGLLCMFTILYAIGLSLSKPEIFISVLLVLSSGFFAYTTLVTYRFYTGLLSKIYKALLLASILLFFMEVSFLTGYILSVPIQVIVLSLLPFNVIFGIAVLACFKYTYDFWISPLGNTKVFYQIVISFSLMAVIIFFICLLLNTSFIIIRYALFFIFSLGILFLTYYLVRKIKGGRMGTSWRFLLIAVSLYAIRHILYTVILILNYSTYSFTTFLEALSIYSYLCAGYGVLKQKF